MYRMLCLTCPSAIHVANGWQIKAKASHEGNAASLWWDKPVFAWSWMSVYRRSRSREGAFKCVVIHRENIWPKRNVFTTQLSVGSFLRTFTMNCADMPQEGWVWILYPNSWPSASLFATLNDQCHFLIVSILNQTRWSVLIMWHNNPVWFQFTRSF